MRRATLALGVEPGRGSHRRCASLPSRFAPRRPGSSAGLEHRRSRPSASDTTATGRGGRNRTERIGPGTERRRRRARRAAAQSSKPYDESYPPPRATARRSHDPRGPPRLHPGHTTDVLAPARRPRPYAARERGLYRGTGRATGRKRVDGRSGGIPETRPNDPSAGAARQNRSRHRRREARRVSSARSESWRPTGKPSK